MVEWIDLETEILDIMKTLCLFANEFPYGNWETYLETEVKYYNEFDKVYIFALQLRKDHAKTIRKVPDNCVVIPIWYAPRWRYLLNSFRVLSDKNLYKELGKLRKKHQLDVRKIIDLFVFLSRSNYEMRVIQKSIKSSEIKNAVFYSYRFEYQPYVAILLRKKWRLNNKIIARAHRYDLYEENRPNKYIPCREVLLQNLAAVFPCSKDGEEYLRKKFPEYNDRIYVRYLGTLGHSRNKFEKSSILRLVSCSNVVPVKRLSLLIEMLKRITDVEIFWTHFGDGILLDEIKKSAQQLPENIKTDFRGSIKNSNLMKVYEKEQFDLFINVSSSEGIPVSIMEAMSFGIPCIATDVGGTNEIVTDGYNGKLLRRDFTYSEFVQAIKWYLNMRKEDVYNLRQNTYSSWEKKYNAETNYSGFVNELIQVRKNDYKMQ